MNSKPAAVAPKTLDLLILETLATNPPMTCQELARIWGEDRVRVNEWLSKFERLGLIVKAGDFFGEAKFRAKKVRVAEYIAARDSASPSS